ncbi:PTS system mannose/fructose/sorbose family transporter subunit IID [Sporolactobacillus terrae]|uniref:PTS N-acetylgalactosamine transporter subunit IID n=1 Tax=Sporolactobacillus terrae TaxID=269673 RepID=A0ABX5Q4Q1_9BACL|nr:PTS system mannose/fructose/sorbose family transporter subunit IID [Sporolactobacillus terrae]QAA21621.1 PTS N-acetylgalactosamine transporter subunit IID [Sporolactobacillus terrae]QAA24593.1 PTS N-acetylgalactosamine transporter subunit IID [Sporolactobacillus terrae]UAK16430.1 PTS system mannose/fructose/sorbose family transporter subunit IID [Sporolactobacillus terrae]
MASNEAFTFEDQKPSSSLTKKELNKLAVRSLMIQASFNYERMQGAGWLYSILPGLRKFHKNEHDFKRSLQDHTEFFNTHPFLVTFIMGVVLAMEEKKMNRDAIRAIKIALMGPLGGIGDALFFLTLLPITAGIGASLAVQGNIAGPIIFLLTFNIIHLGVVFGLIHVGYNTGVKAVTKLKAGMKYISRGASIVGLTVVGGLIAAFVNFKIAYVWSMGKASIKVQEGILDKIMPAMIPLAYTLLMYWLLKKGWSPIWLIVITVAVGLLGSVSGIL